MYKSLTFGRLLVDTDKEWQSSRTLERLASRPDPVSGNFGWDRTMGKGGG